MAYTRSLMFESALLSWQQVTLDAAQPAWSEGYRVEGPRLLLPLTRCFECRIGPDDFVCDPASALWLHPAQPYRVRRPWAGQRSALLVVDEDLGPSRRARLPLAVHLRMGLWARALAAGRLEALQLEEELLGLVRTMLPEEGTHEGRPHRAVERAREYIAAEPQRGDTLEAMASAAHCSPFHLARRFRQQTGQSLHGFRTRLRMALALDRLLQGEANLSALAADLGYASHSHFSEVFRRSFGVAPSRWKSRPLRPR